MAGAVQVEFNGTKEQQEMASRAFDVVKRKYPLYAVNAPLKITLAAIVDTLTKAGAPYAGSKPADLTPKLEAALHANADVFTDMGSGEFATTKAGHAPNKDGNTNTHTFKERLNQGATLLDADKAEEYKSQLHNQTSNRAERTAILEDLDLEEVVPPSIVGPAYPPLPTTPYSRSTEKPTLIPQAQIVREKPPEPAVAAPTTPEVATPAAAAPTTPATAPATPATTPATPRAATPAVAAPATPATEEAAVAAPTTLATAPATPVVAPATPATTPVAQQEEAAARTTETSRPATTTPTTTTPATPTEQTTAPTTKPVAPTATPAEAAAKPATPAVAPATPATPTTPAAPVAPTTPAARPATPVAAPPVPVVTGPVEVTINGPQGAVTFDLNNPIDEILLDDAVTAALASSIGAAVANDTRLIQFGADIFPDEATERFSKGDYRRIKEYLEEPETGGVASDRDIIADVLGRRIEDPAYDRLRFSLNYRLLKEKKDFEFVGVDSDRLWVNAGSSPVLLPTTRKPAEIGQDYRFLEDPNVNTAEAEDEAVNPQELGPMEYSLTYYEYEHGVLPYDRRFKNVFPGAVFEDQRASLLRFEVPQLYGSLLAELRYPTGNRGGFIMGLGELFNDHMIPGAKFTITPTDRGEDVFEIHFTRTEDEEANLIQLDERKGRWVFRPVQYAVGTDPNMLLTQEKFGKLHNQKKLEEAEKRKPDVIIANAFEAIGESNDGKLWAIIDDIFPVVNLDRPISKSWLRYILSGAYPYFYPDESTAGAYFYDASKR